MTGPRWFRRRMLRAAVLGAAGAALPGCWRYGSAPPPSPPLPPSTGNREADDIIARTALPRIPSLTVTVDGGELQQAIDTVHARGGGRVVVPAGALVVGALRLRSRVDLHLLRGATLKFSGDPARYPLVRTRYEGLECVNRSPMIYAADEADVAITGEGKLDASATASWNRGADRTGVLEPLVARGVPPAERIVAGKLRTSMIQAVFCARVLVRGVTLAGSPFWQIHPTLCSDVTIDGVTTTDSGHPNSDGCDPESCERVVIRSCTLASGDDDVALKSGRDEDGRRLAAPCRDVVVFGCQAEGPYTFLACGSEQSGGIENVYACANRTFGRGVRHALWVKSNSRRGGFTRNVNLNGFRGRVRDAVAAVTMNYAGQSGAFPPVFEGIHLRDLEVESSAVLDVEGLSTSPVRDLTVSSSVFTGVSAADRIRNADVVRRDLSVNGVRL